MIPTIDSATPSAQRADGSDFAELSHVVTQSGLLRRRRGYYAAKSALTVTAFAASWVVFGYLGDSWWQLFTAGFLALVCTQLSFIGHDAGHKQRGVYMGCSFAPNHKGIPVERGISYSRCGLLRSYGEVLRHLRAVGAPLRAVRR